mmetsp:Transcript_52311/g.161757  ORF Transcript_52311/g.161757 Transcript_52311/m.161757 type:complete len:208 (-) Transcript_52311:1358-1981(-)
MAVRRPLVPSAGHGCDNAQPLQGAEPTAMEGQERNMLLAARLIGQDGKLLPRVVRAGLRHLAGLVHAEPCAVGRGPQGQLRTADRLGAAVGDPLLPPGGRRARPDGAVLVRAEPQAALGRLEENGWPLEDLGLRAPGQPPPVHAPVCGLPLHAPLRQEAVEGPEEPARRRKVELPHQPLEQLLGLFPVQGWASQGKLSNEHTPILRL